MSAQVVRTPDSRVSAWQGTPVIIKSGGGGDPTGGDVGVGQTPATFPVTIELDENTFDSHLENGFWHSASSKATAKINSLKIEDNGKSQDPIPVPDSDELVMLQVIYGTDMLVVAEEGFPQQQATIVVIRSPAPFPVFQQAPVPDEVQSSAPFPAATPLVIFTQGRKVLRSYQCNTVDVTLTLELE